MGQIEEADGRELLPDGWNTDPDVYELKYIKEGQFFVFKALVVDDQLVIAVVVKKYSGFKINLNCCTIKCHFYNFVLEGER